MCRPCPGPWRIKGGPPQDSAAQNPGGLSSAKLSRTAVAGREDEGVQFGAPKRNMLARGLKPQARGRCAREMWCPIS